MLGLARRDGNRRYYDLLERLLPADLLARDVPLVEQFRHRLLSRYRAHGLLGVGEEAGHLRRSRSRQAGSAVSGVSGRTALREELIADGELVPVEVEGVRGKRFLLKEEIGLLEAPPEPAPSVAFLPPFDPMVWDRGILGSLFGFEYVWELFIPPAKRRWGWYVLPMLFGDRLVGRIEPRIDRGRAARCRCSACGGRMASCRAAPRASSTRCATRSAPICASQARVASSGRRTSGTEKRLFLTRP